MNSIEITATSSYFPNNKIMNEYFNEKFNLDDKWIELRSGIKNRYFSKDEDICDLGKKVAQKLIIENSIDKEIIDGIIVATTSTDKIMPGISFEIQKALEIKDCMCFDILAGCSGYINAFDIARKYIALGELNNVLVIGIELISKYIDFNDINTSVLLGDGAGATLISKSTKSKIYFSNIKSYGENNEILTCHNNERLFMNGREVYKFAITKTVDNINETLLKSNINKNDIKYFILHQSNIRIINYIYNKLSIDSSKAYSNLENCGNTFCASIPIILDEMMKKSLISSGDKLMLTGYGGGLNIGSIIFNM